jgi:hypothetical protein
MNEERALDALLITAFVVTPALAVLGIISGATCGLLMVAIVGLCIWQLA